MRAAIAQTDAEALSLPGDDVGAPRARRLQRTERHGFAHHRHQQRALRMASFGERPEIAHRPEDIRLLDDHACRFIVHQGFQRRRPVRLAPGRRRPVARHFQTRETRQSLHRLGIMRMQPPRQHRPGAPRAAARHQHRLGAGARAVVHRGVGDLHPRNQRDLGLELEQRLQRPLRDLRLIGGVGGQELAALDQRVHRRRNMMAIGPAAEKTRRPACRQVLRRHRFQRAGDRDFARMARQVEGLAQPRCGRRVAIEVVDPRDGAAAGRQRAGGYGGEHLGAVGVGERQIAHGPLRRYSSDATKRR